MRKKTWIAAAAAAGAIGLSGLAAADVTNPTAKDLEPAVKAFLAEHGDLCLGWYAWPRDLTPEEQSSGIGESVQLPVLEQLGIVQSAGLPVAPPQNTAAAAIGVASSAPASPQLAAPAPTRRYSLTAKGRQYYLNNKHSTIGAHGAVTEHDADFCVAHLTLDKVVRWDAPGLQNGRPETVVHYTYHIKAADWMSDPAAQRVLPVVDRVIRGEGKLLMNVNAQLRDGRWMPVMPGQ